MKNFIKYGLIFMSGLSLGIVCVKFINRKKKNDSDVNFGDIFITSEGPYLALSVDIEELAKNKKATFNIRCA